MARLLTRPTQHIELAPAIHAENVSFYYENRYALREVGFDLQKGEHLAVVGPNGAGKTTLFRIIAGILRPSTGVVELFGQNPSGHVCVAYVPQRSQVDWSFPVNVSEVVMMGRIRRLGFFNWPKKRDWEFVRSALERVDLLDYEGQQIGGLSGGQQQRVFLAQAVAQEAELILLDEPLTGLDLPSQETSYRILEDLRRDEITVVVATHDLDLAAKRFDRVMLLNRSLVSYGRPDEALNASHLLEAYGAHIHRVHGEEGAIFLTDPCPDEEEGCR
jgi:manganese/iron transport system ATP-binding protein